MKRSIATIIAAATLAAAASLAGCSDAALTEKAPVVITLASGLESPASLSGARAVSSGQTLDTVSAYRVVFKKVEIGNSEADKFTLWESDAGGTKDIAHPVSFDNVRPVLPGTYNYVRLTIGETLSAEGTLVDPDDSSVVYTGMGTCVLDGTVYLWGTDIETETGLVTIQAPIVIEEGTRLDILFAVEGTVSYSGGPADDAVFGVTKPALKLIAE